MRLIDLPSAQALFVVTQFRDVPLGPATAFVVQGLSGPLLVTNWHVVTGRRHDDGAPIRADGALPDGLSVRHNSLAGLGEFAPRVEVLYGSDGQPRWLEHPEYGASVDLVALPLTDLGGVQLYPMDPASEVGHDEPPEPVRWGASDTVFVVGFPFGRKGSGDMAIWAQGAVASEPALPYAGLPRFLLDARTREGQSGSPVIWYRRGGGFVQLESGQPYMLHNPRTKLLGIYSGRLSKDSDLGTVWNAHLLLDIAWRGVPGKNPNAWGGDPSGAAREPV